MTITSDSNDEIIIDSKSNKYKKVLFEKTENHFVDTLKIFSGIYNLRKGKTKTKIYLENTYALEISLKGNNLDSIVYEGEGAKQNNYLLKSERLNNKFYQDTAIFNLDRQSFDNQLEKYEKELNKLINENQIKDTILIQENKRKIARLKRYFNVLYDKKEYVKTVLAKGAIAPAFENFENYNSGFNSLKDYKGKYVYIDIWATWCKPCLKEFPALKKIKKQFKNKNIEFVGISIDEPKHYNMWRMLIKKYKLEGDQLYIGTDTVFKRAYRINAIPRFLLIDPKGKIVSADAPRPSNLELKKILDQIVN
ncbi:TlpA family protein disulfide reductase [Aquimarina rhabdastrellae]